MIKRTILAACAALAIGGQAAAEDEIRLPTWPSAIEQTPRAPNGSALQCAGGEPACFIAGDVLIGRDSRKDAALVDCMCRLPVLLWVVDGTVAK